MYQVFPWRVPDRFQLPEVLSFSSSWGYISSEHELVGQICQISIVGQSEKHTENAHYFLVRSPCFLLQRPIFAITFAGHKPRVDPIRWPPEGRDPPTSRWKRPGTRGPAERCSSIGHFVGKSQRGDPMVGGWWLSHLPLVGNILLILMVHMNGYDDG